MRKSTLFRFFSTFILPLALVAATGVSIMENPANWQHPDQVTLKDSEMAFVKEHYGHFMNDGIFFMSRFNNGWVLMTNLFLWTYGPLRSWGIYALVSDPNGNKYWAKTQLDDKTIQMAPDHLYLKSGNNLVEGRGMTYKVHFDFPGFFCDLTYKNILPPWKPGDGKVYLTPDRDIFSDYPINSPWADVTGTIKIAGKTLNVVGQGYSDRSLSVFPPTRINTYLYSVRTFSSDGTPREDRWFFGLLESVSHPAYKSIRIPMILLAHGDKWVLTTKNYTLTPVDFVKGPNTPYEYPLKYIIRSRDQGYVLEGEYRCIKFFDFTDIFSELPGWLRSVAAKFLKRPVYFRSLGDFKATLKSPDGSVTQIHLFGPTEYMVIK